MRERTAKPKASLLTPSELEAQLVLPTEEDGITGKGWSDVYSPQEATSNRLVVDWDGENDPANPMNWSKVKRISQVVLISAITMLTLVFPLQLPFYPALC